MAKNTIIKLRSWFFFISALIMFPAVLVITTIWRLFKIVSGKKELKNISGDVALVTGGAHGLGRCIAIELAKNGCDIAIADVNFEGAEETAKIVKEAYKVRAKAYKIDVSNFEEVNTLNDKITNDLGIVTILINNAGLLLLSNNIHSDWKEIERLINVNLTAHFWTNQVFLPNMKAKKRGHIVAIASLAGLLPLSLNIPYTSTKYAVRGMMRALRLHLKANRHLHGEEIYATTVCPGFLETNKEVANIVQRMHLNRMYPLISGEEVAERVVTGILCNEEEIILPSFFSVLARLYEALPNFYQDIVLYVQPKTNQNFGNVIKQIPNDQ